VRILAENGNILRSEDGKGMLMEGTVTGGGGLPAAPEGFSYIVNADGGYLTNADGAYILAKV
jgi:hypothetical protein